MFLTPEEKEWANTYLLKDNKYPSQSFSLDIPHTIENRLMVRNVIEKINVKGNIKIHLNDFIWVDFNGRLQS